MTNDNIVINVQTRVPGKGANRGLRKEKQIPAVVYSPKLKEQYFCLKESDATKYSASKFENTIFTLKSDVSELNNLKVLKKDITVHPVSRRPVHLDFYAVDMKAEVRISIEIKYEGKSQGEKNGGILSVVRREVEIECLPSDIPSYFSIDVSDVELNGSLHVSDLALPSNVKLITPENLTLCTVAEVKEEVAAPAEEAAAAPAEAKPKAEEKK